MFFTILSSELSIIFLKLVEKIFTGIAASENIVKSIFHSFFFLFSP